MQTVPGLKIQSASDLVAEVERRVAAGELAPGARLDPVRVAASNLGLAPNTVAAAYRSLAERGVVVGRGRQGTFVESRLPTHSPLIPEIPPGIVDLASGLPDPALLPDLSPYLAALGGSTTTYGDPSVAPELADAAGDLLRAEGVPTANMAVTGGAVDGVERVLTAHLRTGDLVGVEDPGWFAIVDLIRAMGLRPVPIPVDDEGIQPSAMADVVDELSAVIVTPRSQNPTGAAISKSRAEALGDLLSGRPRILVVEDDHLGPVGGGDLFAVGPKTERWALIRSFSKALGPDLRVAVVAGDDLTVGRLLARQVVGPGWVSHLLQRTVAHLLASDDIAGLHRRAAAAYADRRHLLLDALSNHGLQVEGQTGLNLWVPVADEDLAVRAVLGSGYAVRPGARFRTKSAPGVRVTISGLDESAAETVAKTLTSGPDHRKSRRV